MKPPKLKDIAGRILDHLRRFEHDPKINKADPKYKTRPYYYANSYASGGYVFVVYVTYQGRTAMRRAQAEAYLAWLDAGNVGTHYAAGK